MYYSIDKDKWKKYLTVREVCASLNKVSHMRDFAEDSRCPFLGVSESPAEERKSMFVTFCLPVFREVFLYPWRKL